MTDKDEKNIFTKTHEPQEKSDPSYDHDWYGPW
jgi:hypothetical protein